MTDIIQSLLLAQMLLLDQEVEAKNKEIKRLRALLNIEQSRVKTDWYFEEDRW